MTGSWEAQLPRKYQLFLECIPVYQPPVSRRGKIGAAIFLAFWGPVMGMLEKITKASIGDDGLAPVFVVWLARCIMMMIWITYDAVFRPLFGCGDGL